MDDTISRAAALDALDRLEYTPGEWVTNGLTMCKDAIKALPPAQPDVPDTNVGDMISRQAAISEIMEDIKDRSLHDDPATPEDYAEGYDEGIRNAAAIVLQMPPAQPEIIHCKDCKRWRDSDGVYRRGTDAESKCPLNTKEVYAGTFYCGYAERRTDERTD